MLKDLGRNHTIMLSSHMLSEVEAIVQRVIILRRGHVGLARKLSELETDAVIVVEVRGPADQVAGVLRSTEGWRRSAPRTWGRADRLRGADAAVQGRARDDRAAAGHERLAAAAARPAAAAAAGSLE